MNKLLFSLLFCCTLLPLQSQVNLLDEVLKINIVEEIKMLPDIKTFDETTSIFKNGSWQEEYNSLGFYNYDTLRLCFENGGHSYELVSDFCQLRRFTQTFAIQTANYLDEEELDFEEMYIYGPESQIDSVKIFENKQLDKSIKFQYSEGRLIKKTYTYKDKSTWSTEYIYRPNYCELVFKRNESLTGKTIYSQNDRLVKVESLDANDQPKKTKEYQFQFNKEGQISRRLLFEKLPEENRVLHSEMKYVYDKDEIKITDHRILTDIVITTIIETSTGNKTVEHNWRKRNEKRIIETTYYD